MPKLKLMKKEEISRNVYSFTFQNTENLKWKAGQYLQIILPHQDPDDRGTKRFFTISSAPYEKVVMITTRIEVENSSTFKKALININVGDFLECSEPKGKFIVEDLSKKIIFIAGGIGITPMRSILLELVYEKKHFVADLLYANRDENIIFKDELEEIEHFNKHFRIYNFIAPRIINEDELDSIYKEYTDVIFYLSGPINMIKAIENILYKKGVIKEYIKTDYFPGYD